METAGIGGVRQPPRRQSAVLKRRHSPLACVTEAAKWQSDAGAVFLGFRQTVEHRQPRGKFQPTREEKNSKTVIQKIFNKLAGPGGEGRMKFGVIEKQNSHYSARSGLVKMVLPGFSGDF